MPRRIKIRPCWVYGSHGRPLKKVLTRTDGHGKFVYKSGLRWLLPFHICLLWWRHLLTSWIIRIVFGLSHPAGPIAPEYSQAHFEHRSTGETPFPGHQSARLDHDATASEQSTSVTFLTFTTSLSSISDGGFDLLVSIYKKGSSTQVRTQIDIFAAHFWTEMKQIKKRGIESSQWLISYSSPLKLPTIYTTIQKKTKNTIITKTAYFRSIRTAFYKIVIFIAD